MTLLETIFACFIVSFVCLTLAVAFPTAELAAKKAEITTNAGNLAEAALETARADGFASLVQLKPTTTVHREGNIDFKTQVETFRAPQGDENFVIGARATVTWSYRSEDHKLVRELLVNKIKT